MTEALKPCPFCGGKAEYTFNSLFKDHTMATCRSCGATAFWTKWQVRDAAPIGDAPADLHPATADLVQRFAAALAQKLAAAEKKYGYSDAWASPDWMDKCRADLLHHVAKGDPRDVAAYCAFLWHHGERSAAPIGDTRIKAALYDSLFAEAKKRGFGAVSEVFDAQESAAPVGDVGLLGVRAELGRALADPMWANHCEVSKAALKRWHRAIDAALKGAS